MRIAVISGGGDSPGINAVIRAVVRTARNVFGWECIGVRDGFEGLKDPVRVQELGPREIAGSLTRGGTILGASNRINPFAFATDAGNREDRSKEVLKNLKELGIDRVIVIGGDGTLLIAKKIHDKFNIPIIGVPKTIDNDLSATNVTFGFETAVATATDALDKLQTTAESHHRVMYLEVMGRHAGWIALHAGIAGGAHVILIGEIPFRIEHIVEKIHQREAEGDHYTIVVVSEGAKEAGGAESYVDTKPKFGAPRLGGIAEQVARKVLALNEREYRVTVLGHVQRGGVPIPYDRVLSTRFGWKAMMALGEGESGKMVALVNNRMELVTLEDAVGKMKCVDPDGEMVQTARALGVTFGDRPPLGGREPVRRADPI
jgi:phosphofructokinase-like protein